jgi:hypothetical protein
MDEKDANRSAGYRLYQNNAGQFSFEIPEDCGEVAFTEYTIPTAAGTGKLKSYSADNKQKAFLLGITDLGIDLDAYSKAQVMAYTKDQVIQGSQVIASEKTTCSGYPALLVRIIKLENKAKIFADIIFCIIRDKQYQLEVMASSEADLNAPDTLHFFSSFHCE